MTFSIVARCPRTGQLGVGAVTAMVGVGKLVPYATARTAAAATQGTVNPYLGLDAVRLVAQGLDAAGAVERVVDGDPGRELRQLGVVDSEGRAAAWSGSALTDWTGHRCHDGVSVQGNRLVGPETVDATLAAFLATDGDSEDLIERLIVALEAGEATGADREGALSGTVYIVDTEEYPLWDLRVDHADLPVRALRERHDDFLDEFMPALRRMPTREDPMGQAARDLLDG